MTPAFTATGRTEIAPLAVRDDFPALHQTVHSKPLVYLDSAATALKPQAVIDAAMNVYTRDTANIHRGVHTLSQRATLAYEAARDKVRVLVGAEAVQEIVFVRGTTEAINLVAQSFVRPRLRSGDEILITELEHHSNIVPWQLVCEQTGGKLVVVPIEDDGSVTTATFESRLTERTALCAFAHVSNALGSVLPVAEWVKIAHARGVPVLVDGAQAVPHLPVDVRALGCDFYAFSGHKVYGPSGVGALYARRSLLEGMAPYQGGGDMIKSVAFDKTIYNDLPYRFEAGTPNIEGAIGLGAAIDYVREIGWERLQTHERDLLAYGTELLTSLPGIRLIGTAANKVGVLNFVVEGVHPHDVGTVLDTEGIAIRTGHHCAQPIVDRFGVPATARASLGVYNTREDLDTLMAGLRVVQRMFQ